ncbi:MAG: DNRLRE domain-containing protein, partial [Armatimonadetes bacterium]|nr:DNRLRE domain-containing protein [Armatimonadota bacterium]
YTGDCTGACPTGTETYYDATGGAPAASQTLANSLNPAIMSAITSNVDSSWTCHGACVKNSAGAYGEIRIPSRAATLTELAFHDTCDRDADANHLRGNFFRSAAMWGMYKGVCDYFGATPTWAFYSCEFVSHDIPAAMNVGDYYTVHVTMRNRGVLWNDAKGFHLGAVGESDPCSATTRQTITGEAGPNSTYTFTFTLRAPLTTGTYTTDWQMVRDGFTWFGPTVSQTIEVTGVPDTEPPTVPTALTATPENETRINLSWTGSTDDRGVIGYYVYRDDVRIATTTGTGTTYSDGTCLPSTTYTYEVSAYDDFANESGRSLPAQATTLALLPPTVPQNLRGTGATTSTISMAWDASTDNVGVVGYRVYRNGLQIGTTAGTTYTDSGLNYTTSYTYEVDAYDGVPSYSGKSTPVVLTTQTPPYYTWTRSTSNSDCYIRSGSPDATAPSSGIQVGWNWVTSIAIGRGLVQWDMTGVPAQAAVVNAANSVRVKLYCYLRSSATAYNIDLRKVNADWAEGNATWNSMNANYSGVFATTPVGAQGVDYTWSWNGNTGGLPEQNRGVQVYNTGETVNLMAKFFTDKEQTGGANPKPRLEVDYYDIVAPINCSININGGAVYTTSETVTLTLSASDFPSGMSQMQFNNENGAWSGWEAYGTSKSWTLSEGDGAKTVYVQFKDAAGNVSTEPISDDITLDTTGPSAATVTDEGVYTPSMSELSASWSGATDDLSGIAQYQYAIGTTTPGGHDVVDWTITAGTSVTKTELTLSAGTTYYFSVKAQNGAGIWGDAADSDGIEVVAETGTIADAKALESGTDAVVGLLGKAVTANFGGAIYIQEPEVGLSGIKVNKVNSYAASQGSWVDVAGVMGVENGERVVDAAVVKLGTAGTFPQPVYMQSKLLGGDSLNDYTPGIPGVVGVNNIGLLVNVLGSITKLDTTAGYMYVDDGSASQYDPTFKGIYVDISWLSGSKKAELAEGQMAMGIGICTVGTINSLPAPVIKLRGDADIIHYP